MAQHHFIRAHGVRGSGIRPGTEAMGCLLHEDGGLGWGDLNGCLDSKTSDLIPLKALPLTRLAPGLGRLEVSAGNQSGLSMRLGLPQGMVTGLSEKSISRC